MSARHIFLWGMVKSYQAKHHLTYDQVEFSKKEGGGGGRGNKALFPQDREEGMIAD